MLYAYILLIGITSSAQEKGNMLGIDELRGSVSQKKDINPKNQDRFP